MARDGESQKYLNWPYWEPHICHRKSDQCLVEGTLSTFQRRIKAQFWLQSHFVSISFRNNQSINQSNKNKQTKNHFPEFPESVSLTHRCSITSSSSKSSNMRGRCLSFAVVHLHKWLRNHLNKPIPNKHVNPVGSSKQATYPTPLSFQKAFLIFFISSPLLFLYVVRPHTTFRSISYNFWQILILLFS